MLRPLQRLSYFSNNLLDGPPWRVRAELDRLLERARVRNRYFRITGALLFNDGCFAQILEGEADDLNFVFQSIQADSRHSNVTLLQHDSIQERAFGDWAMDFIDATPVRLPPGATQGDTLFQRLATVVHGGA